jgi:hypothetical protein
LRAKGFHVEKVLIDPDDLAAFLKSENLENSGSARANFVTKTMRAAHAEN